MKFKQNGIVDGIVDGILSQHIQYITSSMTFLSTISWLWICCSFRNGFVNHLCANYLVIIQHIVFLFILFHLRKLSISNDISNGPLI